MSPDTASKVIYMAECASAAYDGRIPTKLPFQEHFYLHDGQIGKHRGFVGISEGWAIIALKGTKSFKDFLEDAKVAKVPFLDDPRWMIHRGFDEEFNKIWPVLEKRFEKFPGSILVSGHSLGASLAALVAFALREVLHLDSEVCLLAPPRIGTPQFARAYEERCPMTWAFRHDLDIVPQIPKFGYVDTAKLIHLQSNGIPIKPARTLWAKIKLFFRTVESILDFEDIEDHDRRDYVRAVTAYCLNF